MTFSLPGATIVVTGGTGFLGRHVAAALEAQGARVLALGSKDYDLRRRVEADRMLAETSPDAVIHLAAVVGGIGANRAHPGQFFYENAVMGIELIEACRMAHVEKVVVSGTVCAYPKHAPVPFSESEIWNGYPEETNAPYGLAKKMLLVQAQAYREQYGMNTIYLLPVNLYGPHDNFDLETSHVIPAMIRKFRTAALDRARTVTLWGSGSPTREFIHVRDAARAFCLAVERYDGSEPVNVGSGKEISIRDLATMIAQITGFDGEIEWDSSRPDGQPRRKLATQRAQQLFGFNSEIDLETGLRETAHWFANSESSSQ